MVCVTNRVRVYASVTWWLDNRHITKGVNGTSYDEYHPNTPVISVLLRRFTLGENRKNVVCQATDGVKTVKKSIELHVVGRLICDI